MTSEKPNSTGEAETEKLTKKEKVEEDIRKNKLRDIARMKEELEKKLSALNENAELLEKAASTPLKLKKDKEYYMLSKEDRKKLKDDLKQKEAEAFEFIKKKHKEEAKRRKKFLEKAEMGREANMKKMEEEREQIKQKEEELRAAKREQLAKSIEESKQKREADIQKRLTQEETYQQPSVYLYKQLEERYKNNILLPMLENKKALLAEKRNIFKPVTKEELEAHQRSLDEFHLKRLQERRKELRQKRDQELKIEESMKKYQNKIAEKVQSWDQKAQEATEKKLDEKRAIRTKMTSYASLLKEVCPVTASEEKALELQSMIQRIKHPVKQPKARPGP